MRLFRLQRQGCSMPGLAHRHRYVLPDIDALLAGCTQEHDRTDEIRRMSTVSLAWDFLIELR